MSLSLLVPLTSVVLILGEAFLAYRDGMFFPSQMVLRYPQGFPLIANGGWWGDLFFLTPILYIVAKHGNEWSPAQIFTAGVIGLLVSYLMHHFVYLKGALPDALAGGGRPISPAGWVHVVYFAAGFALVLLFYFCSAPTTMEVVWVGVLLLLHIVTANHVPFYYISKHFKFQWCTNILGNESSPIVILSMAFALLVIVTLLKLP